MKNISKSAQISKTAVLYEGVTVEDDVIIHDYVVIYPNTTIKKGAEIFDHCTIGKIPKSPGCSARNYADTYEVTEIGSNSILCPGVIVYTGVIIGQNNLLGDNCSIREECSIGDFNIISRCVTVNDHTTIGSHTKIMENTHITGYMTIGNHVFISVMVSSANDNSMGRDDNATEALKGPVIEDYVTIGENASLLPGVKVGKNSMVGACALVTKDVPQNKVVMGIPARIIRDI